MTQDELTRKLNSVGKTVFTEYFETFEKYSNNQISKSECIDFLVKSDVGNESGSNIRCGNAILIFKAKKEIAALKIVTESKRLPDSILKQAAKLISQKNTNPLAD